MNATTQPALLSLTKENFWNELTEKYPAQMKMFTDWIDQYKEKIAWDSLFKANANTDQLHSSKYKFHELPIAMQVGIFFQYCCETPSRYQLIEGMPGTMTMFAELIRTWFAVEDAFNNSVQNEN